jgi:hypothetical protein
MAWRPRRPAHADLMPGRFTMNGIADLKFRVSAGWLT